MMRILKTCLIGEEAIIGNNSNTEEGFGAIRKVWL